MEGGSCNDYDYVCGDPVNGRDLSGMKGKQPALPAEFEAQCNPLSNSNYEELTSGLCTAYRYAQQSGNTLKDFYYQGYNSLVHPVNVAQHSSFNQAAAKYFEACVQGASTSAVTGALTGPEGALEGAAIGCGIGVGKTVVSSRAGNAVGNDLSAGSSGANVGEAGYYISKYGFSQYVTMLSTAGVP